MLSRSNFCRKLDQPCALEAGRGKVAKTCRLAKGSDAACARGRPQLVIVICADHLFNEVFDRLGRGALIMRLPGSKLPALDDVKAAIDAFEPIAAEVILNVTNRAKAFYAPLVPDHNFQRMGGHDVARDTQAEPARFAAILGDYHTKLYKADFTNPKKRKIRGAYMLDDSTAFQEDHLHRIVQTIGSSSRADGFHLINAYHIYGVKTDPGFHFDVMNINGNSIGHALTDVLTGEVGGATDTHLNATPCDRLL